MLIDLNTPQREEIAKANYKMFIKMDMDQLVAVEHILQDANVIGKCNLFYAVK
jgi:hypothetical protein